MFFRRGSKPKDLGGHKGDTFELRPDQIKAKRIERIDTSFMRTSDFFEGRDTKLFNTRLFNHVAEYTAWHINDRNPEDGQIKQDQLISQLMELYNHVWEGEKQVRDTVIGKLGKAGFEIHHELYAKTLEDAIAQRDAMLAKQKEQSNGQAPGL